MFDLKMPPNRLRTSPRRRFIQRSALISSLLVSVFGLLCLVGQVPPPFDEYFAIRPATAICLAFLGLAQAGSFKPAPAACRQWPGYISAVLAAIVIAISAIAIAQFLLGNAASIKFLNARHQPTSTPGIPIIQMSAEAALAALALASCVLLRFFDLPKVATALACAYSGLAMVGLVLLGTLGTLTSAPGIQPIALANPAYVLAAVLFQILGITSMLSAFDEIRFEWQLERMAAFGFVIGSALLIVAGLLISRSHYLVSDSNARLAAAENQYAKAAHTYGDVVSQVAHIYNFLRTKDLHFLNAHLAAVEHTNLAIDELRNLSPIALNSNSATTLKPFEKQVSDLMTFCADIVQEIRHHPNSERLKLLVANTDVKLDDLRQTFQQITAEHRELTNRLVDETDRVSRQSFLVIAGSIFFGLALFSVIIYRVNVLTGERRNAERQLQIHRSQLEDAVAERTQKLSEALKAAESASRAKSAFLSNMSHEIRTPMNAIIGMAHLIIESNTEKRTQTRLEKIQAAAHLLLGIINNILDMTKIEAGETIVEKTDFSPRTTLLEVIHTLDESASAKGLQLSLTVAPDVPEHVIGDASKVAQITVNLVNNAIKFSDKGSIRVLLFVEADRSESGESVLGIEVSDQGIGIPQDKLADIFLPFKQADDSTTRKYGGTGLGLTISQQFAQLMGGTIEVASEPGVGSTFKASVRVTAPPQAQELKPGTADIQVDPESVIRTKHQAKRILVVEDDLMNQEVIGGILSNVGIVPDLADNGEIAIRRLNDNAPYSLVFMDMQMPTMGGVEATRAIRNDARFTDKPIILAMTANVLDTDRRECLTAGMNDFIAKPINPPEFYQKLLFWLDEEERRA